MEEKIKPKKKLSRIQQTIINLLNTGKDVYILKSRFYNHNEVKVEGEFCMQFKKPTFDFLLKNNYIKLLAGHKYIKA